MTHSLTYFIVVVDLCVKNFRQEVNPKGRYTHTTESGVSLYWGLAVEIHNSQKYKSVSLKLAGRDGQDQVTKLKDCKKEEKL